MAFGILGPELSIIVLWQTVWLWVLDLAQSLRGYAWSGIDSAPSSNPIRACLWDSIGPFLRVLMIGLWWTLIGMGLGEARTKPCWRDGLRTVRLTYIRQLT